MSTNLGISAALADDATFQGRVRAAMVEHAIVVVGEAATVAEHDVRLRLAEAVLANPSAYLLRLVFPVADISAVSTAATGVGGVLNAAGVTDALIRQGVSMLWTPLAKRA